MKPLDHINAAFEFGAAGFIFWSCHKLYRDKFVSGIRVIQVAWFALWGFWNLVYYFQLKQYSSWIAGMLVVTANTLWVALAVRYRKNKGPVT